MSTPVSKPAVSTSVNSSTYAAFGGFHYDHENLDAITSVDTFSRFSEFVDGGVDPEGWRVYKKDPSNDEVVRINLCPPEHEPRLIESELEKLNEQLYPVIKFAVDNLREYEQEITTLVDDKKLFSSLTLAVGTLIAYFWADQYQVEPTEDFAMAREAGFQKRMIAFLGGNNQSAGESLYTLLVNNLEGKVPSEQVWVVQSLADITGKSIKIIINDQAFDDFSLDSDFARLMAKLEEGDQELEAFYQIDDMDIELSTEVIVQFMELVSDIVHKYTYQGVLPIRAKMLKQAELL